MKDMPILFFVLLGTPFILAGMITSSIRSMFMAGWGMIDTWIAEW